MAILIIFDNSPKFLSILLLRKSSVMNEFDKLYSPSFWSKRPEAPAEVVDYHIRFTETTSRIPRRRLSCSLNIPYGPSSREKIDIFGIDLADDAPILAFVHGGYWQTLELDRQNYEFIAGNLHKNGIKSIFIGYDLCPNVTLGQINRQIETAVKKCLDYAREKKSKGLFLAGHSTGANMVASLFVDFIESLSMEDQSMIKAAILLSGLYDLTEIPKTALLNQILQLDEELASKMSPLKQELSNSTDVKFYLIIGENESPQFIKQSQDFNEKLLHSNFESCLLMMEDVDHFEILELLFEEEFEITEKIIEIINHEGVLNKTE